MLYVVISVTYGYDGLLWDRQGVVDLYYGVGGGTGGGYYLLFFLVILYFVVSRFQSLYLGGLNMRAVLSVSLFFLFLCL